MIFNTDKFIIKEKKVEVKAASEFDESISELKDSFEDHTLELYGKAISFDDWHDYADEVEKSSPSDEVLAKLDITGGVHNSIVRAMDTKKIYPISPIVQRGIDSSGYKKPLVVIPSEVLQEYESLINRIDRYKKLARKYNDFRLSVLGADEPSIDEIKKLSDLYSKTRASSVVVQPVEFKGGEVPRYQLELYRIGEKIGEIMLEKDGAPRAKKREAGTDRQKDNYNKIKSTIRTAYDRITKIILDTKDRPDGKKLANEKINNEISKGGKIYESIKEMLSDAESIILGHFDDEILEGAAKEVNPNILVRPNGKPNPIGVSLIKSIKKYRDEIVTG